MSLFFHTLLLNHTLHSNVSIPRIGLGTGGGNGGFDVAVWLSTGGVLADTAQTYCYFTSPRRADLPQAACSQVAYANAMSMLGVTPSSQFIISKIEPEDFGTLPYFSGFGRVFDRGILQEMSIESLDMLMFHQAGRGEKDSNVRPPCFDLAGATNGKGTYAACRLQTFQGMQALMASGKIRSIGVSNWQIRDIEQVFNVTGAYPSALEIEIHPWWHEDSLIDYAISKGITLINYAPVAMAQAAYLSTPEVVAIAQSHAITPAQVLLLYGLQRSQGVVIPRSANATHMKENLAVPTLAPLTTGEMQSLANFPQKKIFNVYCQPWC